MDFVDGSIMINGTGQEIYCRYWKPELGPSEKPRALVFMAHGFAEYSSYYETMAQWLTEKKFFAFSHDHVGHGRSQGERTNVSKFSIFTNDVFQHIDKVKDAIPDVPVFIIGYSLGGLMSLMACLERPEYFKGIILIGVALKLHSDQFGPFKVKLAKFMSYVYSSYAIDRLDPEALCRDQEVLKKYFEDPLCYKGSVKAGMLTAMTDAQNQISRRMADIKTPLLIQHGSVDTLALPEGSRTLDEGVSSKDKTLSIYQDGYHMLHGEPFGMKEQVLAELANWIQARS